LRVPVGTLEIEAAEARWNTPDTTLASGLEALFASGTRLRRTVMQRTPEGRWQEEQAEVGPQDPAYLGALVRRLPYRYTVELPSHG
jgi:hypothetical protein